MSEGFFNRWSRRKHEAVQPPSAPADPPPSSVAAAPQADAPSPTPPALQDTRPAPALPTLQDAHALTPGSDFQPFMQHGVGAEVRNAALKKLFADPHFNVMDGLDIYIDDYSLPDPLPAGMLREMASAQFLQLVPPQAPARQDKAETDAAIARQPDPPPQDVAQSDAHPAACQAPTHDHPDLQLQPDPAPADPAPGPGAG